MPQLPLNNNQNNDWRKNTEEKLSEKLSHNSINQQTNEPQNSFKKTQNDSVLDEGKENIEVCF